MCEGRSTTYVVLNIDIQSRDEFQAAKIAPKVGHNSVGLDLQQYMRTLHPYPLEHADITVSSLRCRC